MLKLFVPVLVLGWVESIAGAPASTFDTGAVQASNLPPDRVATLLVGSPVFPFGVHNVAYSPNGRRLAVGDGQGNIYVWDTLSATLLTSLKAHSNWTFSIAWFNDSARLMSGGGDNLIHMFQLNDSLSRQATFTGHSNDVHAVVLNASNNTMFSAGDDAQILVWSFANPSTPIPQQVLGRHTKQVTSLALHPDNSLLASGSRDDTVRLWNTRTGEPLGVLKAHTNDVMSVKFSPAGDVLASGSYDGSICLWKMPSGELMGTLWPGAGWVFGVAFAPNGHLLASATQGGVQIWDVAAGRIRNTFAFTGTVQSSNASTSEKISSVVFHPNGDQIAAGSTSGRVYILASGSGKIIATLDSRARGTK